MNLLNKIKYKKGGITLISLVVTIIVLLILAGVTISLLTGDNGILTKATSGSYKTKIASKDEEVAVEATDSLFDRGNSNQYLNISGDHIQPWMCINWKEADFDVYFKKLKNAGMEYCILQNSASISVKDGKANIEQAYFWVDNNNKYSGDLRNIITYMSDEDVLTNFVKSAYKNNIKIFIGLSDSSQWFEEKFKDETWRNEAINCNSLLAKYIIEEYKETYPNTLYGMYLPLEFYTNNQDYEKLYWADMLYNIRNNVKQSEVSYLSAMPFMISTYVSDLSDYELKGNSDQEIKDKMKDTFKNLITKDGQAILMRDDIICPQDKLATASFGTHYAKLYLEALNETISELNQNKSNDLQYWVNIENYNFEANPATNKLEAGSIDRVSNQMKIASKYTNKLIGFSYAHYYMELDDNNKPIEQNTSNENKFIELAKKNDSNYKDKIANNNLYIKEFDDGSYVYIPNGFYYISGDIESGVVISDKESDTAFGEQYWNLKGNQFVWIPVSDEDLTRDNFRFDNKLSENKQSKSYWEEKDSNYNSMIESIRKYKGFYIARYEPSLDSNGNVQYIAGQWVKSYVGIDQAKELSSKMYENNQGVNSHLVYGLEWDAMLHSFIGRGTIYNTNTKFTLIQLRNSSTWGNYSLESGSHGSQKISGDTNRMETQVCNIFDLAGNFWELTQEKYDTSGNPVLRGGSFWEAGADNPVAYRFIPENYNDYSFLTSFRTALYLK